MPTKIQSTDTSSSIPLGAGDYLYVAQDADVLVSGADAINATGFVSVNVYGRVLGAFGVNLTAGGYLTVGPSAIVTGLPLSGSAAVGISGPYVVLNDGHIHADYPAIGLSATGLGTIYNFGEISGYNAVILQDTVSSDTLNFYNYGSIIGMGSAALFVTATSAAKVNVLNAGTMVGSVFFADPGTHVFDSRLGEVFGTITGGGGSDTILGPSNGGSIDGGAGNDVLAATGDAAVTLMGGSGSDVLMGGGGDDLLVGGTGLNQLWGGGGADTASYAGETQMVQANLTSFGALVGGVLRDTYNSVENLVGGNASDVLVGDAGANRITGGLGSDQLYGNAGSDTFVYLAATESNQTAGYDTIADFQTGLDKLDISAFHVDPSKVLIASGGGSTALYVELNPGLPGYELAIAFSGANAIAIGDVVF